MADVTNIYTPENIARSRARAASMRDLVDQGQLEPEWRTVADEIDAYADEREQSVQYAEYLQAMRAPADSGAARDG